MAFTSMWVRQGESQSGLAGKKGLVSILTVPELVRGAERHYI